MKISHISLLFLILLTANTSYASNFWTVEDAGAGSSRVEELERIVSKCAVGIKKYVPGKPEKLLILAYGSRDSFVEGLKKERGYPEEDAEYFRRKHVPRPGDGNFLVPPDFSPINICHETIHHCVESYVSLDAQLGAMWFDEGAAMYLAAVIFSPGRLRNYRNSILKDGRNNLIPVEEIRTHDQWSNLHKDNDARRVIYLESALLVEYFFEKYSVRKFKRLLRKMRKLPFEEAFKKVTGISTNEFYSEWIGSLEITANSG